MTKEEAKRDNQATNCDGQFQPRSADRQRRRGTRITLTIIDQVQDDYRKGDGSQISQALRQFSKPKCLSQDNCERGGYQGCHHPMASN